MSNPTSTAQFHHMTPAGVVLTVENAGYILTRYLQSYGRSAGAFRQTYTYAVVLPPLCSGLPKASQLYPPGTTFNAVVTLPPGAGLAPTLTESTTDTPDPTESLSVAPLVSLTYDSSAFGAFASKLMAKRVATWAACQDLIEKGQLDDRLQPRPGGQAPVERKQKVKLKHEGADTAILARWVDEGDKALEGQGLEVEQGLSKTQRWNAFKASIKSELPEGSKDEKIGRKGEGMYETIGTADVLKVPIPESRKTWGTVLEIKWAEGEGGAKEDPPILLLTANKVVQDGMEITLGPSAVMRCINYGHLKKLNEEQFDSACQYTERAIRSQLNKDIRLPSAGPSWLILPLARSFQLSSKSADETRIKRRDIDWDEIDKTIEPLYRPFTVSDPTLLADEMRDAMVSLSTNIQEVGQKLSVVSLHQNLSPSSPHPTEPEMTIMAKRYKQDIATLLHPDQPIIEASPSASGRSGGIFTLRKRSTMYLIPELSMLYCFPQSTFRALSTLPTFFAALDSQLIAQQLNTQLFNNTLNPTLLLRALTTPLASSGQIGSSYERLEILGDALIKVISTVDMCLAGPLTDDLRVKRHVAMSNKSLWDAGMKVGLPKYIQNAQRGCRTWVPAGWRNGGKEAGSNLIDSGIGLEELKEEEETPSKDKVMFKIGDKIVADVVESIIAAAYLSTNRSLDAVIDSMKRLHIPVHRVKVFTEAAKIKDEKSGSAASVEEVDNAGVTGGNSEDWMQAFMRPVGMTVLGYRFRDVSKADLVFDVNLRNSDLRKKCKIIGDSLLDYFIIENLYDVNPPYTPGIITHMRHSRASIQALSSMIVCTGLTEYIKGLEKMGRAELNKYVSAVRAKKKEAERLEKEALGSTGVAKEGGSARVVAIAREEDLSKPTVEFWASMNHLGMVGDVAKALLGAVLLDSGGDIKAVHTLFQTHFWPFLHKYGVEPTVHSTHPKSMLGRRMARLRCLDYEVVQVKTDRGSEHTWAVKVHGKILAQATSEWPNLAERKACEEVISNKTDEQILELCKCGGRRGK